MDNARYSIEAIQVCTLQIKNLIYISLFGASFMLIACSEVKILKENGVLFAWLRCHVFYGKSGQPDFYF